MNPAMQPDLSVIILNYNTQALTLACLRSVERNMVSSAKFIEVILVDNASTDDSVEVIEQQFPSVKLVCNKSNLGFARGNNIGLAAAAGRYLLLLNSDTEIQIGALDALISFMEAHPKVGAGGPMLLNTDLTLQPSGRPLPTLLSVLIDMTKLYRLWKRDLYTEPHRDYKQPKRVGEISGAALCIRREVYKKIGGLDEAIFAYYEDVDWCKRIQDAGYEIWYVPQAKVLHHWRGTSQKVSEIAYKAGQDSLRYYFRKHYGNAAQNLIQMMLCAKECAYLVAMCIKQNTTLFQLHKRMLKNVFSPLPTSSK